MKFNADPIPTSINVVEFFKLILTKKDLCFMTPKNLFQKRIRVISFIALIEAVFILVYMMSISRSEKNAWVLGYSKTRIVMFIPILFLIFAFLWVCIKLWKNSDQAEKFTKKFRISLAEGKFQTLADFCALSVPMGIYLLIKWNFYLDTGFDYQTVVDRITPYLLLATLYCFEFLFVYYPRQLQTSVSQKFSFLEKIRRETTYHNTFPIVLLIFTSFFCIAHFLSWEFQTNPDWKWSLLFFAQEFNLDNENVLPAYYSGFLLLSAANLLGLIAAQKIKNKAPFRFQWALLCAVFIYLALDEVFQIHEHWALPLANLLPSENIFYFAWVPSAIILLIVFAVVFVKFFLKLPPHSKIMFLLSGVVYVSGVLGIEMIAGEYMATFNEWGYDYWKLVALEECVEMLGMIFFNYTLLDYIRRFLPQTADAQKPESD